tara:strand:- start:26 stop:685 length:660 start_codon:yes stop_codon:yes gene_type:complete
MTEMKTEMIGARKDKPYANVGERVKAFREKYGDKGQLITTIITNDEVKIVTQTQAIVEGICLGTGLAEEIRGSTQVNTSSALENCETSSIGRAISFATGFMSDGSKIASTEEIQNAMVQQSQVALHVKTMEVALAYVSTAFINAIDADDEEQILECQADMRGNEPLRSAVNGTLSAEHKSYLIERQKGLTDERNVKAEAKHADNVKAAKAFAKKNTGDK